MRETTHTPVLLGEILEAFEIQDNDTVVDCTLGGAGHAQAIIERLGGDGTYIGIDQDRSAIDRARETLGNSIAAIHLVEDNYCNLAHILHELEIDKVQAVLIDLGLSSDQLETSGRGFSFLQTEPLLMTFDPTPDETALTAREIVNTWDEENIADVLYGYGEEQFAKRIARGIAKHRAQEPIETTTDLVNIIEHSVPVWYTKRRLHFATKTFQALRTVVNDEIESLREGLGAAINKIALHGRIAVISFHSVEDRIVKHTFRNAAQDERGIVITKHPVIPTREEIKNNPRARSAKLRIFEGI